MAGYRRELRAVGTMNEPFHLTTILPQAAHAVAGSTLPWVGACRFGILGFDPAGKEVTWRIEHPEVSDRFGIFDFGDVIAVPLWLEKERRGLVVGIARTTGETLWSHDLKKSAFDTPEPVGYALEGKLLIPQSAKSLIIDPQTGEVLRSFKMTRPRAGTAIGSTLYLAGYGGDFLVLDGALPVKKWKARNIEVTVDPKRVVPGPDGTAWAHAQRLNAALRVFDDLIVRLDATHNSVEETYAFERKLGLMGLSAIRGGGLLVWDDGGLWCFDREGELLWSHERIVANAVAIDGVVLTWGYHQPTECFDLLSGEELGARSDMVGSGKECTAFADAVVGLTNLGKSKFIQSGIWTRAAHTSDRWTELEQVPARGGFSDVTGVEMPDNRPPAERLTAAIEVALKSGADAVIEAVCRAFSVPTLHDEVRAELVAAFEQGPETVRALFAHTPTIAKLVGVGPTDELVPAIHLEDPDGYFSAWWLLTSGAVLAAHHDEMPTLGFEEEDVIADGETLEFFETLAEDWGYENRKAWLDRG